LQDIFENFELLPVRLKKVPTVKTWEHVAGSEEELEAMTQLFDYRNEAMLMVFELETKEDFEKVNPFNFGFDEEFVNKNMDLDEDTVNQLQDYLNDYQIALEEGPFDEFEMRNILQIFIEKLQETTDAYTMFREILKVYDQRKSAAMKPNT